MKKEAALRKNPNMVTREIDDELILLPIFEDSKQASSIYTLNKVAAAVWRMLDRKKKLSEIKRMVLKDFDVTPEKATVELNKLIKEFKEIKALQ